MRWRAFAKVLRACRTGGAEEERIRHLLTAKDHCEAAQPEAGTWREKILKEILARVYAGLGVPHGKKILSKLP